MDTRTTSSQILDADTASKSIPHESAHLHVSGEAVYVDDIRELSGTLHCALGLSERAHAAIESIDLTAVIEMPGVVAVFTADDIPGVNDCGPILHETQSWQMEWYSILGSRFLWWLQKTMFRHGAQRAWQKLIIQTLIQY